MWNSTSSRICSKCFAEKDITEFEDSGFICRECHRKYRRQYYNTHRNHILQYLKNYRFAHYEHYLEKEHISRVKLKKEVLTYYGNGYCKCITCGETRLSCLSLDHINGGGTQHRLHTGCTGYGMYMWLKKQNFPSGYQTLCMNCQFIKRFENNENKKRSSPKIEKENNESEKTNGNPVSSIRRQVVQPEPRR